MSRFLSRFLNHVTGFNAKKLGEPTMSRRFEERNVFVTGAGSGFGRRTAELFAAEGAKNLYLIDYKQERLDALAPVIEASGATPHLLNFDLSVMENLRRGGGSRSDHRPET